MKRFGSALVAALLVASAFGQSTAYAWRDLEWCSEDPVFSVLGSHFRVTTTVGSSAATVDGITYDVTVPSDALDTAVAHWPQGKRVPTQVNFHAGESSASGSTFSVTVAITVSGPSGADVGVDLSGPSVTATSWSGTAGATFSKTFDVAR